MRAEITLPIDHPDNVGDMLEVKLLKFKGQNAFSTAEMLLPTVIVTIKALAEDNGNAWEIFDAVVNKVQSPCPQDFVSIVQYVSFEHSFPSPSLLCARLANHGTTTREVPRRTPCRHLLSRESIHSYN